MSDTSNPTAPATPAPAATPTAPQTPAPASTPSTPEDGSQVIYRTQEDFDRAFGERLGRERAKFEREYQDKIKAAEDAAVEKTTKGFNTKLVTTSAKSLARDLGFHDPNDALSVIDADKLPLKDGEVDEDELKKALEKLATDKPYLVKSDKPAPRTATKPKMPEGNSPNGEEPKRKAAEALRELAAKRKH